MKAKILTIGILLASLFTTAVSAQTAEHPNWPLMVLDREKGIIVLADEIDIRTPLAFERTLAEVPNASMLLLDSPGGLVHSALSIATRVRALGLTTVIVEGDRCVSACALVFLAGTSRWAFGDLGVHQISGGSGEGSLIGGQFALADVIEALSDYDAPPELISVMLRTPPDDMYVLSAEEKELYGLFPEQSRTAPLSQTSRQKADLTDPETWRGKVVTGELVSNRKKWYVLLNPDGTTTFQFASGQRSNGQYYLVDGQVCFQFDLETEVSCRRPIRQFDGVRWYDEAGSYQSLIVSVDEAKLDNVLRTPSSAFRIADHIPVGECALVVASRQTTAEARNFVLEKIEDRRFLKAFQSNNGWIAISVGTLKPNEVDPILSEWKATGRIPQDSYCSTGSNFLSVVSLGFR